MRIFPNKSVAATQRGERETTGHELFDRAFRTPTEFHPILTHMWIIPRNMVGQHPTPCILHPTPCTLHPSPYTMRPASCTLHPSPFTLHPAPYTSRVGRRVYGRRIVGTRGVSYGYPARFSFRTGQKIPSQPVVCVETGGRPLTTSRCRANMAQTRQSRPDSGLDLSHFEYTRLYTNSSCPLPSSLGSSGDTTPRRMTRVTSHSQVHYKEM